MGKNRTDKTKSQNEALQKRKRSTKAKNLGAKRSIGRENKHANKVEIEGGKGSSRKEGRSQGWVFPRMAVRKGNGLEERDRIFYKRSPEKEGSRLGTLEKPVQIGEEGLN